MCKSILSLLLILVSNYLLLAQVEPDSSQLLIQKGELEWSLEKIQENKVLKKRVVLKDTTIKALEKDNKTLRLKDKSWKKSDSLHTIKESLLSRQAVEEKQKGDIYKKQNKKLKIQNTLLKVGVILVGIVSIVAK